MTSDRIGRLPLAAGAGAGVAAWLLGYLLTYVLTASDIQNSLAYRVIRALGGDLPVWKVVGWVFFNAHFAATDVRGILGPNSVNFVGGEDGFTPLLFVVPPLLLVGAGLAVARASGATETSEGAVSGLAVAVGYLGCSVAGTILFIAGDGAARPDLVASVFFAGLVYPLVFGTVGAAAGAATADGSASAREPAGGA